ncbi:hypothetical protein CRM86_20690 [Pseudomonas putida]|nr:hypothetical protein CRM86_20690 [Pseudomonas putida]
MPGNRNKDLSGLVKEGFFDVESVVRLFEINCLISQQYAAACAELSIPRVESMVRFLTELDRLADKHAISGREMINLLDPDFFQREEKL